MGTSRACRRQASSASRGTSSAKNPAITIPTSVSTTVPRIRPGGGGTGEGSSVLGEFRR